MNTVKSFPRQARDSAHSSGRTRRENHSFAGLVVFLLLILPSLASSGSFPIGIYDVADEAQLQLVKKAGFNWVRCAEQAGPTPEVFLRRARSLGIGVIAYATPAMQEAARATQETPTWYLFDEPDVHRVPLKDVLHREASLKADFPGSRVTFSLGEGVKAAAYRAAGDFLMVDWYPVPHLPLDSVADQLDAAKNAAQGKPVWMILQAFDWRKDPPANPQKPRVGRFPTYREIRFMTYLSLIHGADGLFYYTFQGGTPLPLSARPGEWQAVRRVAEEVSQLSPFLENGKAETPKVDAPLEARLWRRETQTLLILANRSDRTVSLPANFTADEWKPLFEVRRRVRENLASGNLLEPWQTLVLLGPA